MKSVHSEDDQGEAPLDPAAERLRRKLIRLLLVSFGIMGLGLAAVVAAIVYKINEGNESAGAKPESSVAGSPKAGSRLNARTAIAGAIDLPAGARILTASLDGDHALITIALPDGAMQLLVIDLPTGKVFVRYDLTPQ